MNTRVLELPASHPRGLQWHNQSRDTLSPFTTSPHSRRAIVRKYTVGDPLLRPVDDVNITLPFSSGSQPRDIRPSCQARTNNQRQNTPTVEGALLPSGSVTPKQNRTFPFNISGRNRLFCSSLPKLITGGPPMEFPHPKAQITPKYPQRAISSITIMSWKPSHSRGLMSPGSLWPSR